MSKIFKKGFTLIELLVVIAIIGMLASIVLASLNAARAKSANSAIVGNMQTIRSVANLYYDANESYGAPFLARSTAGYCATVAGGIFSDPKVREALEASMVLNPGANPGCSLGVNGQTWALSMPLKNGGYWCVSSEGAAVPRNAAGGGVSAQADCSGDDPPCDEGLGCVIFSEDL